MNKYYRFLNLAIICTLLSGIFVIPVAADEQGPGKVVSGIPDNGDIGQFANYTRKYGAPKPIESWTASQMLVNEVIQGNDVKGTGVYIVQLVDAPLALYSGGIPGLAATNPTAVGDKKLDANSTTSLAYRMICRGLNRTSLSYIIRKKNKYLFLLGFN